MTKTVKLTEKQLSAIGQIQTEKQALNSRFNDLNQRESTIIELILEINAIPTPVKSVKLEEGNLVVELEAGDIKPSAVEKETKTRKLKVQPAG